MVEQLNIPFPILYDPSREVPEAYGVYNLLGDRLATPSTFIVDMNGVIKWKFVGSSIGDRPSIPELLEQLADIEG